MPKQLININNELVPDDIAVFTANHRALRYGDGLFESMRMMNGELKFADLHADRIQRGMKALKIEAPTKIDAAFLQQKAEELSRVNKTGAHARFRLSVYRDADGLYAPNSNKMGYILENAKLHSGRYEWNDKGLLIDVFTEVRKSAGTLSNYKTANSLVYVLAGIFKNEQRLDEALLLNQDGFLCEAISSNVFVVYKNQIFTPALSEGCIAGVMRHVVIGLAKKAGMQVIEAQINPAVLEAAEEIFLTNASKGIQWVMGYKLKRYFNKTATFLFEELNKL